MPERRKHRRKVVNSRVRVFHKKMGAADAVTRDISDSGVLVLVGDGMEKLKINDEVKLIFLDSGKVDIVFNMDVARLTNDGVGLKFLNYEKNGEVYPISDLRDVWNNQ